MKRVFIFLMLFVFCSQFIYAQSKTVVHQKGVLYFGVGTNLSYYSKSNIRFQSTANPGFDFTLEKVRGKDDRGLNFGGGGAAQYSYQLGYYFRNCNFGVEFNFDHIKYFARPNQVVRVKGTIEGKPVNNDTVITTIVQNFEHSDGANYALFNFVKWKTLSTSNNKKNVLDFMLKAGAGPVIPKTNSTVLGKHYDDQYKVSGYVIALEGGLKYNVGKHFYIAPSVKTAYANYTNFVTAEGTGSQHWVALHFNLLLGTQINL